MVLPRRGAARGAPEPLLSSDEDVASLLRVDALCSGVLHTAADQLLSHAAAALAGSGDADEPPDEAAIARVAAAALADPLLGLDTLPPPRIETRVRHLAGLEAASSRLSEGIAGANDILASTFHWSLQATTWVLRFMLIALPPIAFKLTKRFCLGLQRHDESLLHHGIETGTIRRMPSGEYIEVEEPLPPAKAEILAAQIGYDLHAHHDGHDGVAIGNGHVEPATTNGHAALTAGASASSGQPSARAVRKPVGVLERTRLKLEGFFEYPRESAPEPPAEDSTPSAH